MEKKTIEMTSDEMQEFIAFKAKKEADERERNAKQEQDNYKKLVEATVNKSVKKLKKTSGLLRLQKQELVNDLLALIEIKQELFCTKSGQRSNTFINKEGTARITIGYYTLDNYRDTVSDGIAKVKEYIGSLAKDDESRLLVDAILKLLSRDKNGTLKASRVLQLSQMAQNSGNETFIEGVRIIQDSYQPDISKTFIRCELKNEENKWCSLPLGMTEA